jgi:hypothetical protein
LEGLRPVFFGPRTPHGTLHGTPGQAGQVVRGAPVQTKAVVRRFEPSSGAKTYGLSLVKTWSLEMSLNITNAAKISNTTNAAW